MANFPFPTFNVDTLEGAVSHIIMLCGNVSDAALEEFVRRYAYARKKRLPQNYTTEVLLPRMKRARKIYQTSRHLYAINPMIKANQKGLDALWVFLKVMDDVDIETVMSGPYPSQLSYIKNGNIYHIVCCNDNGNTEMALASQLEIETNQRLKKGKSTIEEKYFFIFSSMENLKKAPVVLKSESLFCCIQYPDESRVPTMKFVKPALNDAE